MVLFRFRISSSRDAVRLSTPIAALGLPPLQIPGRTFLLGRRASSKNALKDFPGPPPSFQFCYGIISRSGSGKNLENRMSKLKFTNQIH